MKGRTPLFADVSRWIESAHETNLAEREVSRRSLLKGAATGAGMLALGPLAQAAYRSTQPAITIVGAGVAGLNAAHHLNRLGLRATVYEGATRTGGRMISRSGIMGPQIVTEIGAEFIDSGHMEMRRLAQRFGLNLIDVMQHRERNLEKTLYFGGQNRTEAEVIAAFRPVAARIANHQKRVRLDDYSNYNQLAFDLDNTPLDQYLTQVGATGWLRDLLAVAYLTEYGCEIADQSALNLVFLIGTQTNQGFQEFGDSDQRYKVQGGNDLITKALADSIADPVVLGHKLEAVRPLGAGFRCTFRQPSSALIDVDTDVLLLTIPITMMRQVDIQAPLSSGMSAFIDECGFGTNSKLSIGFDQRYWRDSNRAGLFFADSNLQSGWDGSQLQPGTDASLTIYTGGAAGVAVGTGTASHQRDLAMPLVEQMFPGAGAHSNGRAFRAFWPGYQWTLGSYTCFAPGQYTRFTGIAEPHGNLFFAGEHCSFDFQGYMEGGAVTGRGAAKAIAKVV